MNVTFFVVGVLESLHKSEGREGTIGEKVFQNLKLNFERFLFFCFNRFCYILLGEGSDPNCTFVCVFDCTILLSVVFNDNNE